MTPKILALHESLEAEERAINEICVPAIKAINQAIVAGAVEVGKGKEGKNVIDATAGEAMFNAFNTREESSAIFGGPLLEFDELKDGEHNTFGCVGVELGDKSVEHGEAVMIVAGVVDEEGLFAGRDVVEDVRAEDTGLFLEAGVRCSPVENPFEEGIGFVRRKPSEEERDVVALPAEFGEDGDWLGGRFGLGGELCVGRKLLGMLGGRVRKVLLHECGE